MLKWVSAWWAIVVKHQLGNLFTELYHGENKLIFNEVDDDDDVHFVLDLHTLIGFL
jgi:hypothetical protein